MAREPRTPPTPQAGAVSGSGDGPAATRGTPASPGLDPRSVTTAGQTLATASGVDSVNPSPGMNATWGPVPVMNEGMTFREVGQTGLRQFSGWVREEFLQVLTGRQGAQKYREMMDNSATIGGLLFAIQSTMKKVEWRVQPDEDAKSGAGQEDCDFLHSCMDDMSSDWNTTIGEILSMLPFGFHFAEIVYKKRLGRTPGIDPSKPWDDLPSSNYEDGKIGWRRLPGRSQDTIIKWFFDENGTTKGVTQQPWVGPIIDIPIEKGLLFRPLHYKQNPEGRPCPLYTKVRTPRGWVTMGEISVGDEVYDEAGHRRRVVGKSDIFRDRPVYEIEFTTGATVRADACHVWRVSNNNDRTSGRTRDMTTEQIANEFIDGDADREWSALHEPKEKRSRHRKAKSISCGVAPVLHDDDVPLPLDPYVLGYWLGNGHSDKNMVSSHAEDADEIASLIAVTGFTVDIKIDWNAKGRKRDIGFYADKKGAHDGPLNTLRMLGVLGTKKVPRQYLNAGTNQRLALLQGLMDSDGWSPGNGVKDEASTFANTNVEIINAVMELVRSLGGQPRMRVLEEAGALGGVVHGRPIIAKQTSYEVRFMLDLPVHRLARKARAQVRRKTHRNSAHFIRTVRRVENADTVCIEVDSPSHLFLVGECMVPTHNSILRNSYTSYYYAKRLQEQQAIFYERMGGVPVIKIPSQILEAAQADPQARAAVDAYKRIVVNLRTDEQMGILLPSDVYPNAQGAAGSAEMYKFELVTPGSVGRGGLNYDATITRLNTQIFTSVLADFLTLGHEARGTQSLAVSKIDMFFQAIEGYLNSIAEIFNRFAIPRLWALNGMDLASMPKIEPDLAQRVDLDVLSNFILRMAQAGMPLFPDEDLQSYIKDAAGLPDVDDSLALQAAGLTEDQLDRQDEMKDTQLDQLQNPDKYQPSGPPKGSPRDNLEKMILKGYAQRKIRMAGPRYGIVTKRGKRLSGRGLRRLKNRLPLDARAI